MTVTKPKVAGTTTSVVVIAVFGLIASLLTGCGSKSSHASPPTSRSEVSTGRVTPWPGGRWQPDPVKYAMAVVSDLHLTMSDGEVLIANVGYPVDLVTRKRAAGTFPVLLTQDPYPSEDQPNSYYVERGYINAVVQVRGTVDTYGPGGKEAASVNFGARQTADGVALVHWAVHQLSGSNGVIGLDGCSFLGIDQIFTAAAVGPNSPIKEILPACAANSYEDYFAGGIPSQVAGLFDSPLAATIEGTRNEAANTPVSKALEDQIVDGGPEAYNGSYWQERTTYRVVPKVVANGIPALLWSGWYPTDGPGSLYEYSIFQNTYAHRAPFGPMAANQQATGRYQVVIGPWMHGQGLDDAIQLEWYDTWLRGENTGLTQTTTPMHLYELQAKKWVNATTYPITNDYTAYHLASNGALSAGPTVANVTDLAWGQPTTAGTTATFNSAPFGDSATVAGSIAATIYAQSSNRNMELIATLFDVAANGSKVTLGTGDILGSLRAIDHDASWYDRNGLMIRPNHSYVADNYAPPDSLQRYDIELPPTFYAVPAGDHLQLQLSTQAATNTCASLLSALTTPLPCILSKPQTETLPGGHYKIISNTNDPSSINLPIISAKSLPVAESGITATSEGLSEPLSWSS